MNDDELRQEAKRLLALNEQGLHEELVFYALKVIDDGKKAGDELLRLDREMLASVLEGSGQVVGDESGEAGSGP